MKNKEITLKDIFELIIPKIWLILIASVLCAGITFGYFNFFKDDTYTSTSKLYVYSDTSSNGEVTTGNIDVAKGMVEVYKIILESDKFLNSVTLKLTDTYPEITSGQIRSMMSVSQVNDTEVFAISITSASKDLAYDVLNEIVAFAPEGIRDIVPNALNVKIVEDPSKAAVNSKNSLRNSVIVFLLAAVASVVVIWISSLFDVVIRDKKKIEDNIDIPILGVIPKQENVLVKGEEKNA